MKSISLRQRTLIGLTAIVLSLGGTLEIASAATASSTRNLEDLTTTELARSNEALNIPVDESELVAIKLFKRGGFKFKKHHGRKFKKHHGRKYKKHHGHKFKKHHGIYGHGFKKY